DQRRRRQLLTTGAAGAVSAASASYAPTTTRPADTGEGAVARTRSAARSPMIIAAVFVFAETIDGITDASATRRPRTPRTRSDGSTTASGPTPMRHVPTGW